MKTTKMTLYAALAVGGLLALSPALQADDATNTPPSAPSTGTPGGPHDGMRSRPMFDRLAERLNLTADQKPKVQAILENQRQQMRAVWQNHDLSREDRMAKMKSIREDTAAKLKAVLTDDQFKQFQQMVREMRERMRERNGNTPPANPPTDNNGANLPPQS